jgi:alpha-galactosidase
LLSTLLSMSQKTENLAPTPPMGWNSWNIFGCDIDEKKIMEIADQMVATGMLNAGYEYLVIDDCWQVDRDDQGKIIADPVRFPSGIKDLAEYIHSKGLKFGIYSCAGTKTCQQRPGSFNYEEIDAQTYAEWGVDYLKYDWCYTEGLNPKELYPKMSMALAASGRPIVFSMCEWGTSRPWTWARNVAHLWRTTGDIQDCWDCKRDWGGMGWVTILDKQVGLEKFAGPDHWNDPDMLEVGNGGMQHNEYIAHFSFWCLLAAPLMAGNDLRTMDEQTKEILLNADAIAINQDPLGIQGAKIYDESDFEIWTKNLDNQNIAMILFNRNEQTQKIGINWTALNINQNYRLYDVWKHHTIGRAGDFNSFTIEGHSVLFFKIIK